MSLGHCHCPRSSRSHVPQMDQGRGFIPSNAQRSRTVKRVKSAVPQQQQQQRLFCIVR